MQKINLSIREIGIVINLGQSVAGNVGSQKHTQYTVIGSDVNLAT
ncbi:MAG: adenylate/guanylate cyclase domain-containing protein [Nostoc sp.]